MEIDGTLLELVMKSVKPCFHRIAAIAERKFSDRSDNVSISAIVVSTIAELFFGDHLETRLKRGCTRVHLSYSFGFGAAWLTAQTAVIVLRRVLNKSCRDAQNW